MSISNEKMTVVAKQSVKQFNEKDFLKDVFFKLSIDISTPPDILDSEFSEVVESEALLIKIDADTDIKYSCMIGRDRKEEYLDVETHYKNTSREEQKFVKKERTVVDWVPHSGTASSLETVYVRHDSETVNETDSALLGEVYSNLSFDANTPEEEYVVDNAAVKVAEKIAVKQCYAGVYIEGDHIENESFDGSIDIKRVSGAVVPEYYLTYKYKDREYFASAYAAGALKSEVMIPDKSEYIETTNQVIKSTKLITYFGMLVILAGVILALCSFFISELDIGMWYAFPIVAGILIILINGCVIRPIIRGKILKDKQEQKFKLLERLILKYDLPPLTQQELKYFKK